MVTSVRSVTVANALHQRRTFLRNQATEQFAAEIENSAQPAIAARIVDYTVSIENIEYLRTSVGLTKPRIRETLSAALRIALA